MKSPVTAASFLFDHFRAAFSRMILDCFVRGFSRVVNIAHFREKEGGTTVSLHDPCLYNLENSSDFIRASGIGPPIISHTMSAPGGRSVSKIGSPVPRIFWSATVTIDHVH